MRLISILAMSSACWTRSVEPQPPPSPPAQPPTRTSIEFDPGSCRRDEIVESVCGASAISSCKLHGDGLSSIAISKLVVTTAVAPIGSSFDDAARAMFRGFALDRESTSTYRASLTTEGELEPKQIDAHCCYSRCTAIVVADPGPARSASPLPTPERCIPRPPAGTSLAATGDRGCPLGVKLDNATRRYVQTLDGRCCYDMR